jgi:hypothetical protein
MKNRILAVLLSAVVLFIWGFVSWAILPWHNSVANKFSQEAAVAQVLKLNAPAAGIYMLPFAEEDHKPGETAAFVNVLPNGFDMNMGKLMGTALFGQIIAALLVLLLLQNTSGLNYVQRLGFVTLVGLVIGFVSHFPYWNWFGFATSYVMVTIMDSVIAWLLAGLVLAKFITGKNTA